MIIILASQLFALVFSLVRVGGLYTGAAASFRRSVTKNSSGGLDSFPENLRLMWVIEGATYAPQIAPEKVYAGAPHAP